MAPRSWLLALALLTFALLSCLACGVVVLGCGPGDPCQETRECKGWSLCLGHTCKSGPDPTPLALEDAGVDDDETETP